MLNASPNDLHALADAAKAGDRRALEALVRALQGSLYRVALRFLGHPAHAQDATQEILILIVTRLGTFRGESTLQTWAYRIATRHLFRQRRTARQVTFESLVEEDLAKPPNQVDPLALASADQRLLEEEVFVGCTQAMLQALDPPLRMAFVLGAILELEASDAAAALEISEPAFRKRLSRAREALDNFVSRHCGVANPANACRCAYQINHNLQKGRLNPTQLRFALPAARKNPDALRTFGDIQRVRTALELYRSQPEFQAKEDFAQRLRELIESAPTLSSSGSLS
ncbi:MAG TPA: RNA polymerase sigma factor [Polyangiaceae bacterium]|nr:RNA polymerase sigma factor [Polyangiaceae bacterium]